MGILDLSWTQTMEADHGRAQIMLNGISNVKDLLVWSSDLRWRRLYASFVFGLLKPAQP